MKSDQEVAELTVTEVRRLLAVGMAANFLFEALFGAADVRYIPHLLFGGLDVLWLLANSGLALVAAFLATRSKED